MVKISVIMPVFNGEEFLEYSIGSIVNQTLDDVEIICIDDGSTDDTLNILKNLEEKYDFLKIFSQDNLGPAKARNVGLDNAEGEYVAFLDDDDMFFDPNALEVMYNFAKDNNANVVSANLQFFEQNDDFKENWHYIKGEYAFFDSYGFILPDEYGIPYGFTKCIFNRNFLLNHNIVFPKYITGEDPYFLAKVMVNTNKIYTVPLDLYGYHYSMGGGVNAKINTYDKKLSYVSHFFDTCKILLEGGLKSCGSEYKLHLLHYLTWRDNIFDEELYLIFNDLFGDIDNYFDESYEEYIKFNVLCTFHNLLETNNNDYFLDIKNKFSNIHYSQMDIVSEKLELILNSNSLYELQSEYKNNPIEYWVNINNKINDDSSDVNDNELYNQDNFNSQNLNFSNDYGEMLELDLLNQNKILINQNRELIAQNMDLMNSDPVDIELINQNRNLINQNRELINRNREKINNHVLGITGSCEIITQDMGLHDNYNDIWVAVNDLSVFRENDGTKLVFNDNNSNWQYLFLKDENGYNELFGENAAIDVPCIFEFDLIDQKDSRFDLFSNHNHETPLMDVGGIGHWKIVLDDSGANIYVNNELKLNFSSFIDSIIRFGFVCTMNNSYIIFKNFKVYKKSN